MRRGLAGALVGVALVAVAVAPPPATPASPELFVPVGSATLVCPEITVTDESATVVAAVVAPVSDQGAQAGQEPDGAGGSDGAGDSAGAGDEDASDSQDGSAVLRTIDGARDLAEVAEPGRPVTLLVADRSAPPIITLASGSWAPDAIAGMVGRELDGAGEGIFSTACPPPGDDWWFVGAGSQLGRSTALLVSNPSVEPARFDISLYASSGIVAALAGKGISLGPQSQVRLRLDALAPDEELLAVHVQATSGRVAAALRDVSEVRRDSPQGVDYIPAAQPPTTRQWLGGIPGGDGARDLVLVNPGTQFAAVQTSLLTEEGPTTLEDLPAIAVPAGSVVTIPLARVLDGRAGTLEMISDVPITGGVRSTWGAARRDVSWSSSVPVVVDPTPLAGAGAVPGGPGLTTTVTVVAPQAAVTGTLSVMPTGSQEESIFAAEGGPLVDGTVARDVEGPTEIISGAWSGIQVVPMTIPGGTQRTITVPGTEGVAVVHLAWRSDPGSGPAVVSHLTLNEEAALATGYSWWPTASAVRVAAVREDLGTLAPAG